MQLASTSTEKPNFEIVWRPLPGSQTLALDSRAHDTLLHGTRGPGKTVAQLMRYRRRVGLGYGAFWRGIIFDREFKNLDDVVAQSKRFFNRFDDGAQWLSSAQQYKWVWPSGEELLFRHVKSIDDYDDFHGHEYPFIGWNELTKQPTSELYDKLMSTNRSSFIPLEHTPRDKDDNFLTADGLPLPPIPLETFSTTNPNGPGHNWVKRRFISVAPNGVVVRKEIPIFNPQTQHDEIFVRKQVAIFGSYRENRYLDPKYVAELNSITDPNLRKAWLGGNWDVMSGGAFDDLWSTQIHVKERFRIPANWYIDRAFDWGSSHPFSVGWFAEANGEEVKMPSGFKFCPPRGSLIQFAEWYGTKDIGSNKGLIMSAGDVAEGIKAREIALMENGWIADQPWPGPADNQIRDVREADVDTIELKMADKGIRWTESDKSPGSRRNGMQLFRDRLQSAITGEGPAIYFMANCEASIETIPALPRDSDKPDDIDTTAEDHPYDMVRYRILRGNNRLAKSIHIQIRGNAMSDPTSAAQPLTGAQVAYMRPEVSEMLPKWEIIRDCIEQNVKLKGETYLPRPNAEDVSNDNKLRYAAYTTRAVFYDATSRTLNGLVGQIYANDPAITVPSALNSLLNDANGNGVSLVQVSREATTNVTGYGRGGLYIDYPAIADGAVTSKLQQDNGEIKPTINFYAPQNVINWKTIRKGAKHIYSQIVLVEYEDIPIDAFSSQRKPVYRVLRLAIPTDLAATDSNPAGTSIAPLTQREFTLAQLDAAVYTVDIWRPDVAGSYGMNPSQSDIIPKDGSGKTFNEIPFTFIGSDNNNWRMSAAPLLSIAELNIGHYRNSADYEEATFIVGQPTYAVIGITQQWYEGVLDKKIAVGSRSGIPLPIGADVKIVQVQPNTMAMEAMKHKEAQMMALGAKLVQQDKKPQTATEVDINNSADVSALATIAKNVSAAFTWAIQIACRFANVDPSQVEFSLNTDFAINRLSSAERAELIAEWTGNAISFTEMRRGLRDTGVAFQDDEVAKKEIQDESAANAKAAADAAGMMAKAVPPAPVAAAPGNPHVPPTGDPASNPTNKK